MNGKALTSNELVCLICACEEPSNESARDLMHATGATSATGVIVAIFVAYPSVAAELVGVARKAIAIQRMKCPRLVEESALKCPLEEEAK
ncbi:MAG TPA: hypothetical protein VF701_07500 [Thermoanaerobaculia bacterium]